ncbi:MAG: prevent-host-death protein [Pseudanabaena sp.]
MTIKEQLIREIEQTPEASLIKFIQIWRFAQQSGLMTNDADDWEQNQETLFVLQNDSLMKQIALSITTHEKEQGYQPSKGEVDEIVAIGGHYD